MAGQSSRPFYGEYAWAFDLLIDRPVGADCVAITAWLIERGVLPGATLLDAGCGTGRYAGELARRGYVVEGVDRSPDLIETARRSVRGHGNAVSFRVGDLLALPEAQYDSILCRGVLNDFVDEDARLSVFEAFARERTSDYRFVMRCWTGRELESAFVRNGFGAVAYFGAYDPAVHAGATDRLVAVAQSSDRSRG